MKRAFAVLLVLAMLCASVACGAGTTERTRSAEKPRKTEPVTTPTTEMPTTLPPVTTEAPTQPPTDEPTTPALTGDILGKTDGLRYENATGGFCCEVPDTWYIASAEERASMMGIAADFIGGDIGELLKNNTNYIDFYAADTIDASSINVGIEKLPTANRMVDLDSYIDALCPILEPVFASSLSDYDEITAQRCTAAFLGESISAMQITAKYTGITLHGRQVYIFCQDYLLIVTVVCQGADRTDELLAYFSEWDI